MAKLDELKEEIGAIKTYLGFIVAFIITIGAGVSKLFLDNSSELLLVLGVVGILIFAIILKEKVSKEKVSGTKTGIILNLKLIIILLQYYMPRKERYQEAGHYHIINRGVERRSVYLEPEDYEFFLDLLLKLTKEYEITMHAFCLMTNHYHLLLETKQNNLSKAIQFINDKYAKYFNKKYTRSGHLWQGR